MPKFLVSWHERHATWVTAGSKEKAKDKVMNEEVKDYPTGTYEDTTSVEVVGEE